VEVPAGWDLAQLPSGLTRNAFVCPFGTFNLVPGTGHAQNYSSVCRECPEKAQCIGGANMPECLPGTYSIGSGLGLTYTRSLYQLNLSRFVPDSAQRIPPRCCS
jgi:hypothetical protein